MAANTAKRYLSINVTINVSLSALLIPSVVPFLIASALNTLPALAQSTASAPTKQSASAVESPHIDELAYWEQLRRGGARPDLHNGLMLKPEYRSQYLAGHAVPEIKNEHYSSDKQDTDERWISAHQAALKSFRADAGLPLAVANYPIEAFVGYKAGQQVRFFDQDGFCYKVFFDFTDAARDLTPELYLQFSRALAAAGFVGDSKIAMTPGFVRFNYNDVIVHTGSPEQAKLATRVGMQVFGSRVAHIARGVDVKQMNTAVRDVQDWHEFLSTHTDLSALSAQAKAYVAWSD